MKKYSTIIIKSNILQSINLLCESKDLLEDTGNIFLLIRNEYFENGDIKEDLFDVIKDSLNIGLLYINTIVAPTKDVIHTNIPDNVLYIIWLAKNKNHFFNKDAIREDHIWKNVEWGRREKNYNPKGKDPGNVWIPTKDDGKANITKHILFTIDKIIKRIYDCSNQSECGTLFYSSCKQDQDILKGKIEYKWIDTNEQTYKFSTHNILPNNNNNEKLKATIIWNTSERMFQLNDKKVDLVVTSPPYWNLKDYFKKGQIGQEDYNTYLSRLNAVWTECYNHMFECASMWININVRVKNGQVILIPKDIISQCKKIGFHYKGIFIWHKSSGIPTHNKNIVDRFEYVLIFSKSDSLTINTKLLNFHDYKNEVINNGAFWNINRKAGSVGKHYIHPAIFPNELVNRIINITTIENQTIMDPFLGSGTSLISAILSKRNFIGYEYNEGFKEVIESRINKEISLNTSFDLQYI